MKRYDDWVTRFNAFIKGRYGVPFSWGSQDCCVFAADGVLAITGHDFAQAYRGYSTAEEAAELLVDVGGCQALATRCLGEPIRWSLARRGDVVLHVVDGRESLGLCAGGVFVAPGPEGLVQFPMDRALMAWSV
ncbi:DUF6950 family protein [Pigmentiphaga daeguensis]|uniref:DUF6950 domain-containing protein n=1 Tax=Pigmentiphaga daeguensis TaxID=414049 RepID=A0ABN1BB17_9BURK